MNYLVLGVIALWCVSAWRKSRYGTKPTEVLPGSRTEALREILAKAKAGEPHAVEVLATVGEECNKGV
jgi:hypothetical protein